MMNAEYNNQSPESDDRLIGAAERQVSDEDGGSSSPVGVPTETLREAPSPLGEPVGDSRVPKRIGHYHIERVLASGGMGTVYEATQEQPHRTVALKLMKHGITSRAALRRFEYESQILGRLQHPGIAQVYEAGTHRDECGTIPYFVMEYVIGAKPITEFARVSGLVPRQKLDLFAQVCDAVHHGHQKGIIHRDLKPSNILVNAQGHVKVIDFGVARATDSDLAVTTLQTDVGQLIGTLHYMSPEQCAADPHAIDTRSDVYSLGVVLYELLCGRLPYELTGVAIHEATRIIRERQPTKLTDVDKTLKGDIETIVLKAVEKDRERRYQSATDFGQDLRRYLDNEAITARPPSRLYQFRVLVRRNKPAFAAIAMVFVALLAGVIASTSLYLRAENARQRAVLAEREQTHQRERAVAAREEAEQARFAEIEQRRHAEAERDRALQAEHEARRQAYLANIAAAQAALSANEIATVRRHLDAAPAEFRNWEWRYLDAKTDVSLGVRVKAESMGPFALNPDGTRLASTLWDKTVHLWDMTSGQELDPLRGHEANVFSVAFHPDGTRLASGSEDTTVRVWDVATGKALTVLRGHVGRILSVAFSPDGTRLASPGGWGWGSGTDDNTVRIWDLASGEQLAALKGHEQHVHSVAFSPDGTRLASGSWDNTVRLWDVRNGQVLGVCRGHEAPVNCIAFGPKGTRLASASGAFFGQLELDNTVRLWDTVSCRQLALFRGHKAAVNSVAFSPQGRRLASGSFDNTVRLWDTGTGGQLAVLRGHQSRVWSVAFTSNGTQLLSGSADGTVRLWDVEHNGEPIVLRGHEGAVFDLAFSPDGVRLASAGGGYSHYDLVDHTIRLWDVGGGEQLAVLRGHEDAVNCVAFSPDGERLASGSSDHTVRLWDAFTGEQIARLYVKDAIAWDVTFSPDGNRLAAACTDDTGQMHNHVRLWNSSTGEELGVLRGHEHAVTSVKFSLDGTCLGSASKDGTVRLWDASTGEELRILKGRGPDQVHSLAFAPDGTRVASALSGTTVRIWRVTTGEELAVLRGHDHIAYTVAFSPDGTRLASGSYDTTVRVWDSSTGTELCVLRGHRNAVRSVEFSPDGTRLASSSDDRSVRIWDSVPYRVRYQERQSVIAARPEARRIVDALWGKCGAWKTAAARLRADSSLTDPVRHAALNEVLRRATAAREEAAATPDEPEAEPLEVP